MLSSKNDEGRVGIKHSEVAPHPGHWGVGAIFDCILKCLRERLSGELALGPDLGQMERTRRDRKAIYVLF